MPQNPSSSDLNIKTAADQLARRAFIVSRLKSAGLFKQADLGGTLKGLGQSTLGAFNSQPDMVRDGLIGAGVGGLGGAAIGAIRGHDDPDAPSPWSTGLTGALAGGAIGAGAGLAGSAAHKINTVSPDVAALVDANNSLDSLQPPPGSSAPSSAIVAGLKSVMSHPGTALGTAAQYFKGHNSGVDNVDKIIDPKLLRSALNNPVMKDRISSLNSGGKNYFTNLGTNPNDAYVSRAMHTMREDPVDRGLLNDLLKSHMGKDVYQAGGLRSLIPGMEQNEMKAMSHSGNWLSRLALPAAGFAVDTYAPPAMNWLAGKPLYGTPAGSSPDIVAKLQQYAKAHPEWIQQARESGKYIPPGVAQ